MRLVWRLLSLSGMFLRFVLLVTGLAAVTGLAIAAVDRNLPVRVRELLALSRPRVMEWVEAAPEFNQGQRTNAQVTSGESGGLTLLPGAMQGQYVSPAHLFPSEWNALGAEWRARVPPGTRVRAFFRHSPDGRNWSDWEEAQLDDDLSADGVFYIRLCYANAARYLQYRLALTAETPLVAPFVHRVRWVGFDSRPTGLTATPTPGSFASGSAGTASAAPSETRVRILPRAAWGADESLMKRVPEYQKPVKIVIHHTATFPRGVDSGAALRALYLYHALIRGWNDLAYNYVIDPEGNIYEGRAGGENVTGPHARQYSYGSLGIGLLGNYELEPPPDAMQQSLVELLTYLTDYYGIDPRGSSNFYDLANVPNVLLPSDLGTVAYPGKFLAMVLPDLRNRVWERVRALPPKLTQYGASPERPVAGKKAIVAMGEPLLTAQVEFYLDGKLAHTVQEPTNSNQYVWDWDTTQTTDGPHVVRVAARGRNGTDSILQSTYIVDNHGPAARVSINDGAQYTRVPTLTLTISATDVSGVAAMQFVDPAGVPLTEPEPMAPSKTVVLRPGDGTRLVAMRFSDSLGNKSEVVTASIVLDTAAPGDWANYRGESNRVSVSVADKGSGINLTSARYALSHDAELWGEWQNANTEWDGKTQTARLVAPQFVIQPWVKFYAEDLAGNISVSPAYTVTVLSAGSVPPAPTPASGARSTAPGAAARSTTTSTVTAAGAGGRPVEPTASPASAGARAELLVEGIEVHPKEPAAGQPATFVVTVRNQGAATKKGFWVVLWIDPARPPGLNTADPSRDNLVLWHVPALGANEVVALTSAAPYQPYTTYPGRLAAGKHRVLAMVDAVNPESRLGLVSEIDEDNNLRGPLIVEVAAAGEGPVNWWQGLTGWR